MTKKGDKVYFSTVGRLVNEGTVLAVEGPYIRVETKAPGVTHVMESEAFPTKDALTSSEIYSRAYWEQHRRRQMQRSFTQMASLWV